RGQIVLDDLCLLVARRDVAGVEHGGCVWVSVGELSCFGQVWGEGVDVDVAVAGKTGRQVVVGGVFGKWHERVAEAGQRGPVDRVVDGLPKAAVGEQRTVGVQREEVQLGARVD